MAGCEYVAESSFELASESRLPKWFSVPPGTARKDLSVTMSYYIKPEGRIATFTLFNSKSQQLAKVVGTQRGLEPLRSNSSTRTSSAYEVITVGGVAEIIEHRRMEPIFYITDDPELRKEFGVP